MLQCNTALTCSLDRVRLEITQHKMLVYMFLKKVTRFCIISMGIREIPLNNFKNVKDCINIAGLIRFNFLMHLIPISLNKKYKYGWFFYKNDYVQRINYFAPYRNGYVPRRNYFAPDKNGWGF